jgi:hypothetical protein
MPLYCRDDVRIEKGKIIKPAGKDSGVRRTGTASVGDEDWPDMFWNRTVSVLPIRFLNKTRRDNA